MKKIHIQAYHSDMAGSYYYRMYLPLIMLSKYKKEEFDLLLDHEIDVRVIPLADVLMFQRIFKKEIIAIMTAAKKKGIKIVVDLDDDILNVPLSNPASKGITLEMKRCIVEAFRLADAMFVSTLVLKEKYSGYNSNIAVHPNSILPEDFSIVRRPKNNKKFVIGWAGSNTHDKDIGIIRDVIELLKDSDKVLFKFFGAQYKGQLFTRPVRFESYYSVLASQDFDLGLAPLIGHDFNDSKSNIKWLEYSMMGTPTLASDVGPYKCIKNREDGFIANNPKQWVEIIAEVIDNATLLEEIANKAKERVLREFNMNKNYKTWYENIKRVVEGEPVRDYQLNIIEE